MPATSIVPAEVERWRRLASLVGTALLVQKTVPAAWVNLIFGRIVTEPLGPLIPSSMLATCESHPPHFLRLLALRGGVAIKGDIFCPTAWF